MKTKLIAELKSFFMTFLAVLNQIAFCNFFTVAKMVMSGVFTVAGKQIKIFRAIIQRVMINVMNNFTFFQKSAKHFFGNKPMFLDISFIISGRVIWCKNKFISCFRNCKTFKIMRFYAPSAFVETFGTTKFITGVRDKSPEILTTNKTFDKFTRFSACAGTEKIIRSGGYKFKRLATGFAESYVHELIYN